MASCTIIANPHDHASRQVAAYLRRWGISTKYVMYWNIVAVEGIRNFSSDFSGSTQSVVWFRKYPEISRYSSDLDHLCDYVYSEALESLLSFYWSCRYSESIRVFGEYLHGFVEPNKYEVLLMAQNVGLEIPYTIITNTPSKDIHRRNLNYVCKPITQISVSELSNEERIGSYSQRVNKDEVQVESAEAYHVMLQAEIDKVADIRSFYCCGHFYTTAYLPHSDVVNAVDHREDARSRRVIRHTLPDYVRILLEELAGRLHIQIGCFDLILNCTGQYVFLEVNPVGEYSYDSHFCNLNLDYIVANEIFSLIHTS